MQNPSAELTPVIPAATGSPRLGRLKFVQAAPPGFGDRHNSWAWSMLWWKGKLYVGTNRAWHCAERAGIHAAFPLFVKYPSNDPDADCAPDPCDLPLQAEIWRWTPETDEWERVYQSPRDVPIPGHPGKFVAREVGFRDMAVFVEPDGVEAMYVSGVNAKFIFHPVPPPRLMRTTDGLTFEPVPQTPGTFLGDLDQCAFRTLAVYKERLFVSVGSIQGDGILLESSHPAGGNNHFRQVSPPGMRMFEMLPFNGYLYVGVRDVKRGYAVLKTDATGDPPYAFTPVVTAGAFLLQPSRGVISMQVYKGRLYVGTDRPATEVIRINPDDTWDLVIGTPRETPDGWQYPLSGLDAGFNSWLTGHIWRMAVYEGRLYIGTYNMSTHLREVPGVEPVLEPNYGFDLYETADGWHYAPVTLTGFNDKFNLGARSFANTPHGLFLGTANNWRGLQIWRGAPETVPDQAATAVERRPPERLEIEYNDLKVLLSWERPAEAQQFRVWRADIADERRNVEAQPFLARVLRILRRAILPLMPDLYLPPLPDKLWIPGAYSEIGTTAQSYFEDTTALAGQRYAYYVRAETQRGDLSTPSNLVTAPPLTPPVTFDRLLKSLDDPAKGGAASSPSTRLICEEIKKARACFEADDSTGANHVLQELSLKLETHPWAALDPLILESLQMLLMKLRRRIALSQAQLVPRGVL